MEKISANYLVVPSFVRGLATGVRPSIHTCAFFTIGICPSVCIPVFASGSVRLSIFLKL